MNWPDPLRPTRPVRLKGKVVMIEATKSLGFKMDETEELLGTELKIAPQVRGTPEEIRALMQREDPIRL